MKKIIFISLSLITLSLSGCGFFLSSESSRVHNSALIAKKAVELQDPNDTTKTKDFMKANARAWSAFDQKLNGKNAVIYPENTASETK
jgi:uncharacterized protein YxeA